MDILSRYFYFFQYLCDWPSSGCGDRGQSGSININLVWLYLLSCWGIGKFINLSCGPHLGGRCLSLGML